MPNGRRGGNRLVTSAKGRQKQRKNHGRNREKIYPQSKKTKDWSGPNTKAVSPKNGGKRNWGPSTVRQDPKTGERELGVRSLCVQKATSRHGGKGNQYYLTTIKETPKKSRKRQTLPQVMKKERENNSKKKEREYGENMRGVTRRFASGSVG